MSQVEASLVDVPGRDFDFGQIAVAVNQELFRVDRGDLDDPSRRRPGRRRSRLGRTGSRQGCCGRRFRRVRLSRRGWPAGLQVVRQLRRVHRSSEGFRPARLSQYAWRRSLPSAIAIGMAVSRCWRPELTSPSEKTRGPRIRRRACRSRSPPACASVSACSSRLKPCASSPIVLRAMERGCVSRLGSSVCGSRPAVEQANDSRQPFFVVSVAAPQVPQPGSKPQAGVGAVDIT